jgi:hypothetical protein
MGPMRTVVTISHRSPSVGVVVPSMVKFGTNSVDRIRLLIDHIRVLIDHIRLLIDQYLIVDRPHLTVDRPISDC